MLNTGNLVRIKTEPLTGLLAEVTRISEDMEGAIISVFLREARGAYKIGDILDLHAYELQRIPNEKV